MKTIRIELSQVGATLNLTRNFEESDLRGVEKLATTIEGHILQVFNKSYKFGIRSFKFSKAFKLNITIGDKVINFKDSIFAELGLEGFRVVNTDKSKQRLAAFIGELVKDAMYSGATSDIFDENDVVEMAKKILLNTTPEQAN